MKPAATARGEVLSSLGWIGVLSPALLLLHGRGSQAAGGGRSDTGRTRAARPRRVARWEGRGASRCFNPIAREAKMCRSGRAAAGPCYVGHAGSVGVSCAGRYHDNLAMATLPWPAPQLVESSTDLRYQ